MQRTIICLVAGAVSASAFQPSTTARRAKAPGAARPKWTGPRSATTAVRMSYLDEIEDKVGTKTILRVPWGPPKSSSENAGIGTKEGLLREGGIGSTGGITISREAIRDISAGEFDTKEAIKVPWSAGAAEDGIFKKGGIGSTGGIALSRDAIRDLKGSRPDKEIDEILVRAPAAPAPAPSGPAPNPPVASEKSVTKSPPEPKKSAPTPRVDKPVTLGLAEGLMGGSPGAKTVFGFLQSKTYSRDREGFILGDVFADGVVRNGGFSEFSEKVNGRLAQLAFPMALASTNDGDLLSQLAAHPVQALSWAGLVTLASLPPLFDADTQDRRSVAVFKAMVPAEVREQLIAQFEQSPLKSIFTEKAELTNSRAAMIAMGVYLATAVLF